MVNKKIKTMMGRIKLLLLLLVFTPVTARAVMVFDFQDGAGNQQIGAWDWQQTSFFAANGNLAVANYAATLAARQAGQQGICDTDPSACQFVVYTHARLTGVTDPDSKTITPNSLGRDFEITMTMAFTETVSFLFGLPGSQGTIAGLSTVPGEFDFINIFYDTNPNSNTTTGYGFNDGILIMKGSGVSDSMGMFQITTGNPTQLDISPNSRAASDDYGDGSGIAGNSQLTVTGYGIQSSLYFSSVTQDSRFVKSLFGPKGIQFQSISLSTYTSINPSDCFSSSTAGDIGAIVPHGSGECDNVHDDDIYANQTHSTGLLPVLGDINGDSYNGTNPDFLAQTDYASSFDATFIASDNNPVPSPGALALFLFGLSSIGTLRFRRRL